MKQVLLWWREKSMRCAKFYVAIPGLPLVAPTYDFTVGAVFARNLLCLGLAVATAFATTAFAGNDLESVLKNAADSPFVFEDRGGNILRLTEDGKPVFEYVYDVNVNEAVAKKDKKRGARGCYIHPLFGVNGEVLTDDYPTDHFHHHGVFWCWPNVRRDGISYNFWEDSSTIVQCFVRWNAVETAPAHAVLDVENGWYLGEDKIVTENVRIRVHRRAGDSRSIDVSLAFTPLDKPISLVGARGKGYGGPTVRFKPKLKQDAKNNYAAEARITNPDGVTDADLLEKSLPWADFTSCFDGRETESGAAIFIHPTFPDFPPICMTRHYGAICVGWPGVKERTLEPGKRVDLDCRIWIHGGPVSLERLREEYDSYSKGAPR